MKRFNIVAIAGLSSLLVLPGTYAEISQQASNQTTPILANNTLSPEKIRQLAQAVTVKVFNNNKGGSGVLISKQGQTYTILTNAHVISTKGTYSIQTPDSKTHRATLISRGDSLSGNDLAVLQFQAQENYQTVPLATNSNLSENQEVLAAGFPDDSKELVITNGKISLLSPQPLIGGYQIGYTNEIRQGMSGGTLLNQEGKLIGINGLHNNAILNDTYTYQDGTIPNAEEIQRLKKYSFAVPIQTLAKVAPNLAVIPPEWRNQQQAGKPPVGNTLADKINNIAQQITVKIDSKKNGNGSGVIIARQGQTYYVATARHVVENPDSYEIITPDGERYAVQLVQPENFKSKGTDAALIKFTSNKNYTVATISKDNRSAFDNNNQKKMLVFVSGFPAVDKGNRRLTMGFLSSKEDLFSDIDSNQLVLQSYVKNLLNLGHELRYSNLSLPGMSGGPVLNIMGEVIGINVASDTRKFKKTEIAFHLGIPSNTILGLATKAGLNKEFLRVPNNSNKSNPQTIQDSEIKSLWEHPLFAIQKPAANANEDELLQYANRIWRLGKYSETAAILRQIIKSNPDDYQAHFVLGLVLTNEEEKGDEALATFNKVTTLNPEFYEAWKWKSNVLLALKRPQEALAAIDKAIKYKDKDDKDLSLYIFKTAILAEFKRYPEALAAIDKAIEIEKLDFGYLVRASVLLLSKDYPAALVSLSEAIKLNPNNAKSYILQGNIRVNLKDYQAALADFNQAIELQPDNAEAYYLRGNVYKKLKDNRAAIADFNHAIKLQPNNADAYFWRGNFYQGLKDNEAAIADFNHAIKLQPGNTNRYVLRGIFYFQLRDDKAAFEDFNHAIKLQPSNADAYYWRGNVHKKLRDDKAALADYNQAIILQPDNGYAYYWRGIFYKDLKNDRAALADFHQAIKFEAGDVNAYHWRGDVLYRLKKYQEALADYTQAIKLQPDNANNYILRGIVRKELKDYQAALADYTQAIKLQPDNGNAYYWRSEVLYLLNKHKEALADSNQALKILPPNDTRPLILRGNVRVKLKKYQEALADFNQAIKLQPNKANNYQERGAAHYVFKKYQEALADFNQAIKLQPNDANNYILRGKTYKELKNYQAALTDYNQAIKLKPDNPDAYYWRGNVNYWLRDYQAALADYNQVIKLQPDNPNAYYWRSVVRYFLIDYQAALTDLNQAIKVQPDNANAHYWRGMVRNGLKDYQAALADCNQAIKLQPNDAVGYYCRGVVYQKQGDDKAALSEYAQALAKDKKFAAANAKIGYMKYERGDVEGAIQEWQKAIQIDSDLTGAQLALAVVLYSRGEQQKALNMAQATLRLDKTLADVEVLKQSLWGTRLIAEGEKLLSHPNIQALRVKK